jgi:hypothetical protein
MRRGEQRIAIEILASADIAGKYVEDLVVRITGSGVPHYVVLAQGEGGSLKPMAEQTVMALTNPTTMPTD